MPDIDPIKVRVEIDYDGSGLEKAKEDLASLGEASSAAGESVGGAGESLAAFDEQAGKNTEGTRSFGEALAGLPKIVESGEASVSSFNDVLAEHQSVIADTVQSLGAMQEPMQSYNESLQALSETVASPHFAENMAVFQDALENPYPFSMVGQYLRETGQTWDDFTNSIGNDNTAMLHEMATNADNTHAVLGGMASDAQSVGKSFYESAGSAEEFTRQFNGLNDVVVGTNASFEKTGAVVEEVGKAAKGAGFGGFLEGEFSFGDFFGGALGALNDIAMPLFAMQMIGQTIGMIGQSMYDAAAVAEGPAAHSFGSFTGAVDTLGASAQHSWQQFSEGWGQGLLPTLDAINNVTNSSSGNDFLGALGKSIGQTQGLGLDITQIIGGSLIGGAAKILTLNPENTFGNDWIQSGWEGMQNLWAQVTGAPEPFPGPMPPMQNPMQGQIDALYAQANDPQYLAAQAYYQSAYAKAQRAQASYDVSHYGGTYGPADPMNGIIQYELLHAQGVTGITNPDPNYAYAASFGPIEEMPPSLWGCFVAGTKVLMDDGSEKPIETLQIGDKVRSNDGPTTILALITPPPKQVYELVFSDGRALTLTNSHPVATAEGWKALSVEHAKQENPGLAVSTLELGDQVITLHGTCTLVSIRQQERTQVYNIEVDEPHTFYANKILVHNKFQGQGIGAQISEQMGSIQLPTIDLSGITSQLASAFTGISLPALPDIGGMINGELGGMFGSISLPAIPDIGSQISGALGGMFAGITIPTPPDLGGMLSGAMDSMFGGISLPEVPDVGGMLSGAMSGMFGGISLPPVPDLGAMINGALSGLFGGISLPSIPGFASGVEGFGGGAAFIAENGPELVTLPQGASVYPLSTGAAVGGNMTPISLGSVGGGSAQQSINLVVQLDSQAIISAIGLPLSQNIRLSSGLRGF